MFNSIRFTLIAALTLLLTLPTNAEEPNYSFAGAEVVTRTFDNELDLDYRGFSTIFSAEISEVFHAFGVFDYGKLDSFDAEVSTNSYLVGAGTHIGLGNNSTIHVRLGYEYATATFDMPDFGSFDESLDAFVGQIGFRSMLADSFELGASLQWGDLGDSLDVDSLTIHLEYSISDGFAINLNGTTFFDDSDTRSFGIGLRYYWDR